MELDAKELQKEKNYLKECLSYLDQELSHMDTSMEKSFQEESEFRKYIWQNKGNMDAQELRSEMQQADMDAQLHNQQVAYYRKLYRIKDNPYFGRIDFTDEDGDQSVVYIGITHLTKEFHHYIYDWRSPIASLFYEEKLGPSSYRAPSGTVSGTLTLKRQYKIEKRKMKAVFDNNLNVTDDFLQEVLASESGEKMKNIVNTIQKEQDQIIRNTDDKHLVVQGIAGSGKTSVALHRIAYLLYRIPKLTSKNVLIFSPNNIFAEYISNVLPELGEANALETTFHDFAKEYIDEYESIESFTSFIERYYLHQIDDVSLSELKLSDDFIRVMNTYYKEIELHTFFYRSFEYDEKPLLKDELNVLLHDRYSKLPLFNRIDAIAEHICDIRNYKRGKHLKSLKKRLYENLNLKHDFKTVYTHLFKSKVFQKKFGYNLSDEVIKKFVDRKDLLFEDTLPFIYMKGLMEGFPYSSQIKQIVIDEAQDYNLLQYIILRKIFPRAAFTILGDVNQTINPVYHYDSLERLCRVLVKDYRYVELTKTYRSSPEIIEYSNRILGLRYAVSVRRENHVPVTEVKVTKAKDLKPYLEKLVSSYHKVAVITKTDDESEDVYQSLHEDFEELRLLRDSGVQFMGNLVIVPSYLAKGLEFDAVIIYTEEIDPYQQEEKYLYYVAVTRAQHCLILVNQQSW